MKTTLVIFTLLLAVPTLRAQIVADGTTNTLSNVTTNITGDVTVGTNGSFTLLVLSDNALLTNSANGVISRNAAARSNEVHLISPSARWLMNGTLIIGSNGANSTLVISNGAFVRANAGQIGRFASGSNVVLVTGAGSLWSNVAGVTGVGVTVGVGGSGNQLIISNGGWVINANGSGTIGNSGSNNVARVTGPGSVWSNRFSLNINPIGVGSINNGLIIENGGQVFNDDALIAGLNGSSNNFALVTGSGSLWNNRDLHIGASTFPGLVVSNGGVVLSANSYVGNTNQMLVTGSGSLWSNRNDLALAGRRNTLSISDSAWLVNGNGYLGGLTAGDVTASNNLALLTGAGSTWSNWGNVFVGFAGQGNQLVVSNSASMSASNVFVGFNLNSLNNRLTVDGGTLRITNLTGNGTLDVRRGTNVLNAGLIEVDRLLVTNTSGRFVFNGGTLAVGKITIANSFDMGDGVNPVTLNLTGDNTHSFPSTLVVRPNATLKGNGTILVPVFMQNGATLSPGTAPGAIGRLTSSGSGTLSGTSIMEIGKSGLALTNDQLQVAGSLTYLSALTVSHLGPDPLTAGDRFQLFPAGSYAGFFVIITLPPLDIGLGWVTNLLVDGSIEVASLTPSVTTLPASGVSQTTATLNGMANPKGAATSAWFEWGTTTNYGNVTPPQALGSGTGDLSFSDVLTGLNAGVTYHFRAVGSNNLGLVVVGADQSFPKSFADLVQQAYLKASNTDSSDEFGSAVATSGDTVVVGAPREESNTTGVNGNQGDNSVGAAGAAYVFVRNGANWSQQAYLKAADPIGVCSTEGCIGCSCFPGDFFGSSVAVSGDTIVVGASQDDSNATGINGNPADNSATNSGAAYVFARNGTNWTQQAYLKASNTGNKDQFGVSVAVSGDTIVVGASTEDSNATGVNGDQSNNSATDSGAAYVFVRNGPNWTQQAYLKAGNTGIDDTFGRTVAISGNTIIVGAPKEEGSQGAAYVFVRNGTNWTQQAYLKASNTNSLDLFGSSVDISADTVLVGAPQEDSNATGVNGNGNDNSANNAGAAYVFVRNGTNWTQEAYLKASNSEGFPPPSVGENFGSSVAVSGDAVVVGARNEDSNASGINGAQNNNSEPDSGAAYVFIRNGTDWSQQAYVKASNTDPSDRFGTAVAVSGDTVVVGAIFESSNATGVNGNQNDNSTSFAGAAYVFGPLSAVQPPPAVQTLPASALAPDSATLNGRVIPNGTATHGWFEWGTTTNYGNLTPAKALGSGTSVTNFSEVLTGLTAEVLHHFRAVASNSLGVLAYGANQSFGTPSGLIAYLKPSNTEVLDLFGFSLAISGDSLVVGSSREDSSATGVNGNQSNNSASDSGAAYVFVRGGNSWVQQAYLKASNTDIDDEFSTGAAISGDTIVISARFEDSSATGVNGNQSNNSASDSGAAYVFVRNGTNWTQQAYLKPSNTGQSDNFGNSISISGDTVVIGAPLEDSSATGINGDQSNNSGADSGAAYVFVRTGTNWTQQAYLKPSNTTTGDFFGGSVSVSGDTVAVGSRFQDSIASNSGAVYVFVRNGTNWTQQAQLNAGNAGADDEFGRRVALSGDTLVVGAALEDSGATGVNGNGSDNSATNSGAVYVFVRSGTTWSQQAYLKASNTGADDNFGLGAVAVAGDIVVVGAQGEDSAATVSGDGNDNNATDSGATYVFMRNGTNWTQHKYLKAINTDAGDVFGNMVAVSGSTVVVGAVFEDSAGAGVNGDQSDNNASAAGAVYVYELGQSAPPPLLSIVPSGASQVTLSWTPPTPGFVLQEALNLTSPGWSNSPSGETNPITLPVTEQTKFFRLFRP